MTMPTTVENEIRDFVLATVTQDMNILNDLETITDESAVGSGGLDLDSLSLIELTIRLEERFGVEIPDADIEPLGAMTLGELVGDIVRRGAKGGTAGSAAPSRITTEAVRHLLSDRKIFPGLDSDLDDEGEVALDSLGLVWLLHEVEERYGLVVEPTDEDIAGLTSVQRITEYLSTAGSAGHSDGR